MDHLMENTRKTPFYQNHKDHNARMIDFGGWLMPVEYESILKEAKKTRVSCGLFDASHMGEIEIRGKNAQRFLQQLVSNDISLIKKGQLQYNLFLNEEGCPLDDLMVYNFGEFFWCVVNASNRDVVSSWLKKHQYDGVEIIDHSDQLCLLALQGPYSEAVMKEILGDSIQELEYMHFTDTFVQGKRIVISRSGYTGEDGFELYFPNEDASFWWDILLEKGKKYDLALCGLGARDILRIEAGYPLYGHEINTTINPFEAGLNWAVKLNKDFIGKDALVIAKKQGVNRKRIGFVMEERAVPRMDYAVYSQGEIIGTVASGTYSPNADKYVGMAYVKTDYAKAGVALEIKIRDRFYRAKVVSYPFVAIKTKK